MMYHLPISSHAKATYSENPSYLQASVGLFLPVTAFSDLTPNHHMHQYDASPTVLSTQAESAGEMLYWLMRDLRAP